MGVLWMLPPASPSSSARGRGESGLLKPKGTVPPVIDAALFIVNILPPSASGEALLAP
jgi:hypothetical protein